MFQEVFFMNAKNLLTKVLAGLIALVMVFGALVSLKGEGVSASLRTEMQTLPSKHFNVLLWPWA